MFQIVVLLLGTQTVFFALIIETVCTIFAESGLCNTDKKATYTPHLTIAKTSKTSGRRRVKVIDPKCYEEHKDDCFGTQLIDMLELLSMTLPADRQGYYYCYSRETFSNNTSVMQCCRDKEHIITDIKQSTDDNNGDEIKTMRVLSSPCSAVKFTPRVLLISREDKPNTGETDNTVISKEVHTKTEPDVTKKT